jgi:NAD(P)H-flavin reductase
MAEPLVDPPYAAAPVLEAWDETPQLRALRVDLGRERAARYTVPGQVLKLRAPTGTDGYYAIASAPTPGDGAHAELLIKRGGALADAIIAAADSGALPASDPFGRGFPVDEARGRDVLLFAAGSGIAPVRALVQHVIAARGDFGRVELYYGQREAGDFAFQREHAAWERAGVRVILCASRAADGWTGAHGHVQDVARSQLIGALGPQAAAFVCGMKPMVAGVRETLAAAGLAPERVYLNY